MKTILMTGAAGGAASLVRSYLREKYQLRLSDRVPIDDLAANESFVAAELSDSKALMDAMQGVDAVIHLGAFSVESDWETIRDANILGTYNVYEAARQSGVKRIIFASSNHAVGFYERTTTIDHTVYPKPDSRYGVSKVFGEALASLYADKYDVASLCLRIGAVSERPNDRRRLAIWSSPRDLAQLLEIGIEHPDIRFEIVFGISDNAPHAWYDNSNAERLGYQPKDRSDAHAEEVLQDPKDEAAEAARRFQGGLFVVTESGGDPNKPDLQ